MSDDSAPSVAESLTNSFESEACYRLNSERKSEDAEYFSPEAAASSGASSSVDVGFSLPHCRTFEDIGIERKTLHYFRELGFQETAVQVRVAEMILSGRSCWIEVNSLNFFREGVTTATCLAVAQGIDVTQPNCQAVIACPNRELSFRAFETVRAIGEVRGFGAAVCIGGVPIAEQVSQLRQRPHVVVGTIGRLRDLCERRLLNLSHCHLVVAKEFDRMLEVGLKETYEEVMAMTKANRQFVGFGAGPLAGDCMAFLSRYASEYTVFSSSEAQLLRLRHSTQQFRVVSASIPETVVSVCRAVGPHKPILVYVGDSDCPGAIDASLNEAGIPSKIVTRRSFESDSGELNFQHSIALSEAWKCSMIQCIVVKVSDVDALASCTYFARYVGVSPKAVVAVNVPLSEDWSSLTQILPSFRHSLSDRCTSNYIVHVVDASHSASLDSMCASTMIPVTELATPSVPLSVLHSI